MATPNCGTCVVSFRVTCYMFTIVPTYLFSHVHFSLSSLHQLEQLANLQQSLSSFAIFSFLMWLLLLMPCPLIGPFIFRDLGYLYQLVDPGQVLCAGLILPCRSFRPLSMILCRMAFCLSGKVVALHLDNRTAKF